MIKRLLAFFCLVAVMATTPAIAQNKKGGGKERLREMIEFKVKYISQEIELKEEQQKQFVTLYTQMCNEMHQAMHDANKLRRSVDKDKNATDADYKRASQAMSDAQIKVAQIEKKYNDKFKTFLSQKQIFKMKEAEDKFRAKLYEMREGKKKK